jgi:hypothetical protein
VIPAIPVTAQIADPELEVRMARVLDRIEHRQTGLGLRFWWPPLWLEVTMTGPDSDLWPAGAGPAKSWDWQSSHTCAEAEELLDRGADDDELVIAVGRYAIENLILNAVHEIGEWLRFDGERIFPAHLPDGCSASGPDEQGNGAVRLTVTFPSEPPVPAAGSSRAAVGPVLPMDVVGAQRFTYLPGTDVSYDAAGPVIQRHVPGRPPARWACAWSPATVEAVASGAGADEVTIDVQRDVHRALVSHEADRICRAFHIDGRRCWWLAGHQQPSGPGSGTGRLPEGRPLEVETAYIPLTVTLTPTPPDEPGGLDR